MPKDRHRIDSQYTVHPSSPSEQHCSLVGKGPATFPRCLVQPNGGRRERNAKARREAHLYAELVLIPHSELRIEFEIGMPPLLDLWQHALVTPNADDRMGVVEVLGKVPEKVDQEFAGRFVVRRLEEGGQRLEVIEEGNVVPFENRLLDGGSIGSRQALQISAMVPQRYLRSAFVHERHSRSRLTAIEAAA